jgi:hypothetical protein
MNWMSVFSRTAQKYGLCEDLQQEIIVASMEATMMGLDGRESRNYVARCLHHLMKAYGIVRKKGGGYLKVEIPTSSLGGEWSWEEKTWFRL